MATVYLAHDIKHDRQVAIKVLKPELAAVLGAERFVVEIKTTAALQHPHILPLFDSGSADGFLFYVMPYVQGETLRDKLSRETQLGIDEAVRIARDVADALDYAHRHGVIHRDIKPENILLHDGRPMVADFGIALALSAAAGGRMTETGMSLGTPHYMSPEQATADKEISGRSDIYSLGSVLYEMLAGEPPHVGHSAQQIIMKIIAEDVQPVTKHRKSVPPNVAAAVAKSLEKLPADRFETAKAFADALANPGFQTVSATAIGARARTPPSLVSRLSSIAILGIAIIAALWGWLRPTPAPSVLRYGLSLPPGQTPDLGAINAPVPAPDGSFLVYLGPADNNARQLWIKRREDYAATPVAGTLGSGSFTLSPNGEWIALIVGGRLLKIPVGGGASVPLTGDSVGNQYGLAWLDNGTIVYASRGGESLMRIAANGGAPSLLWHSDSMTAMVPNPLPGGRGVLFRTCTAGCPESVLWIADLKSGTSHVAIRGASAGVYVPTGHIVYSSDGGGLFAIPFNLGSLTVNGDPVALGVQVNVRTGLQMFRISAAGTLVISLGGSDVTSRIFELVWVDRSGRETPVDTAWKFRLTELANNHGWSISPNGSLVAIGLNTSAGDDIWIKPLPTGAPYRATFDPAADMRPHWSSDSRFFSFVSARTHGGVFLHRADGTGADSLIFNKPVDEALLSPDNRWLIMRQGANGGVAGGRNISGLRLGSDTVPVPILASEFDEEAIALSPDGKFMAYQSDEPGRTEIFVRPFPNINADKRQVSSGGGVAPLWSRDGKELFYLSTDKRMMAARLIPGSKLAFSEPVALFRLPDELLGAETTYYTPWDVARDGRFLMPWVS